MSTVSTTRRGARELYDGYSVAELRRHAREMNIPGRSKMDGQRLLAEVRQVWDANRKAREEAVLPYVHLGALLRFTTHPDCVIRVTSGVTTDERTGAALYVRGEYVSMCWNCDGSGRGEGPVTDQWRLDYHNRKATGAGGYAPYRFFLWSLEEVPPADVKCTLCHPQPCPGPGHEVVDPASAEPSPEQRAASAMAAGLRQLARVFEENPDLVAEFSYSLSSIREPCLSRQTIAAFVRAAMRQGAEIEKHFSGNSAGVIAKFGPVHVIPIGARTEVCERVVTGTREVTEEVPDPEALAAVPTTTVTRTEEIVEWRCGSLLADALPAGGAL